MLLAQTICRRFANQAQLYSVPRRPRSAGARAGGAGSDRVRRRRFCLLLARQK